MRPLLHCNPAANWVWLCFAETPSVETLIGGAIVFAAVIAHIAQQNGQFAKVRSSVFGAKRSEQTETADSENILLLQH